jgi:hypothetical protein
MGHGQRFGVSSSDLDPMTAPDNVIAVGSPQQLIEKILYPADSWVNLITTFIHKVVFFL